MLKPRCLVALSLLLLAGCSQPTSGKWKSANKNGTVTLELKPDGSVSQVSETSMGKVTGTGTYKRQGDQVEVSIDSIESSIGGSSVKGAYSSPKKFLYTIQVDKITMNAGEKPVTMDKAN